MVATYIPQPRDFRRTMVFVDGTNVFYRLRAAGLRVSEFAKLFRGGGNLIRTYLYTTAPHHKTALANHGASCLDGIRVTFGTAIPLQDGNYKEKGVGSLLVADMIYHAARTYPKTGLTFKPNECFCMASLRAEFNTLGHSSNKTTVLG